MRQAVNRPPDIVPDVPEEKLREVYGPDADVVIAFKRFLRVAGPVRPFELPLHWYAYARGDLTSAEAIAADDAAAQR